MNDQRNETLIRCPGHLKLEQEAVLSVDGCQALALWQARCGEILTVQDDQQNFFRARLSFWQQDEARIVPFEAIENPESPVEICVYQALPEKERFEWIVQKLTEIGVVRIVPFTCARSTTLEQRDAGQRKSHRWPDVILRAARQCRRALLPQLDEVRSWQEVLEELADWDVKLLLAEKGMRWSFGEGLGHSRPQRVALLVGPEGGFEEQEVLAAQQRGAVPVQVGPRILRTETAAVVGATLVQGRVGDYV
ncbi:MAG: 16S rRNA (uracil(1498)-N(3))-methyltransferase [Desulfuromonadaceae bacterium]|nr:16S rRNA (uracil(1498)-N(3))-methyltransferase [Desulfuromonadaceae bacterium]